MPDILRCICVRNQECVIGINYHNIIKAKATNKAF